MRNVARRRGEAVLMLAALVFAANTARAEPRGTVVEFGRTEGRFGRPETKSDRGTGLAPARPMYGTRYLDHSDRIEARLCRGFGMTVRISGGPVPEHVDVRVLHPRFTRPDGATSLEDDFPGSVYDGQTGVGFTFDNAWELEPGRWRIVVLARGVELGSKTFEVVLGPPGSPRSDCPGALET